MTLYFCTLFDRNYLPRALALHSSLVRHCPDFMLWMLCLDDASETLLQKLNLPNVMPLRISDLNDRELESTQSSRTIAEFSWTSKPSLLLYVLHHLPEGTGATYLDADLFLFSDPRSLYKDLQETSIAITPHRFVPPNPKKETTLGIYNAGWLYMRNDSNALACLTYWRAQCIEWCFNRKEDGRYGDQVYLNDWAERWNGLRVLDWIGVNVGPWNIPEKEISIKDGVIHLNNDALIFYHFHGLKMYVTSKGKLRSYPVSVGDKLIYRPYLDAIQEVVLRILECDPYFVLRMDPPLGFLRYVKQTIVKTIW